MPYNSEKQRKYFHAHLNSLPKGSKEYNKWKKVVDTFDAHSMDESKQFLDEDITSGNIIVYHRTGKGSTSPVEGISADGYRVGKGAYHGIGVYTTYDLESQLKPKMVTTYGNIIIESKVLSLDKFLIFDYDIAKKVYGNKNYRLDKQLKLILGKDWYKFEEYLHTIDIRSLPFSEYTSRFAKEFFNIYKNTIIKYLRGLIFTSPNDGKVLISYDRENVIPLRYTNDEGETWTNMINKNIYQKVKKYKSEDNNINYQHILNKLDVGYQKTNIHLDEYDIEFIINNIEKFIKYLNSDSISNILGHMENPENFTDALGDKAENIIMKLNSDDVDDLLYDSFAPEKIKQILQKYGKLPINENLNKMKSPLDEIFKSLGSLKEELNEQNKVNVKKRNLQKVKQFILEKRKTLLNEEVIPQEKKSEEINFNSKFGVKNKFIQLSKEDIADLSDEIINLVNNAYKHIGGHFELKEPKDLLNTDITYWIGSDIDEDPYSDGVIGGKETKFGTKLTTMGQDGKMQSKADVLQKLRNLLSTKGFYIEADSFILARIGLPPITDEDTIKNVIGKSDIVLNSDGSYQRNINGHISNKFLIGIPKYSSKAPLDEQDLEEARRKPEVNYDPTISQQIGQFVNKYKGQEDLIFVSFRRSVNVTFINPKNDYNTPTGLYTYPWQNFYEKVYEKNIKNYVYPDTAQDIPYQGGERYLFMYKLKSNQGILTNQTTYNDTLPYVKKLFNIIKNLNNEKVIGIVKTYMMDYNLFIQSIYNQNDYSDNSKGDVHKFWLLLYEVAQFISKNKPQDTVSNLCRAIGINGFVDYNGVGFIHTNEPHQAVFFRGRGIFDDIKIIDTESSRRNLFKPSSIDRLLDDIENLDSERIDDIILNAPNNKILNQVIDKIISNEKIMSQISEENFHLIFKIIDEEKRYKIINKFLSKDILPKKYLYVKMFKYASYEQQKVIIKIIFKNFKNELIGSNIEDIISNLKSKEKDEQIIKDRIINFIINNKESFPGIYLDLNFIRFILDNISRKYHEEIKIKLLNYRDVVYDIRNIMMMISSDEKQQEVFIDNLLKSKHFLEQNIFYKTAKNMSFLLKNGNLTKSSFQKIVDKIIQIKPSILRELLNKNYEDTSHNIESDQEKSLLYVILKNTSYNIDSLVDNLSNYFTNSPSKFLIFLCYLSNPKKFVDEKIGDEKMRKIFKGLDSKLPVTYIVDNKTFNDAKNKEEIIEIYKKYVTDNSENQTPVNEIFKSLTSLQEELNEQNKVNIKERNLEKVKQFLKKKKTLLNENYNPNIIDEVFIETPELNEIGTKENYNNYLSSVFNGESDLFYRGDVDGLEKFYYSESQRHKFGSGIYFTTNKPYAILYANDIPNGKVYKCLVNTSNKIEFPNQNSVFKYVNNYFNMGNALPSGVDINNFTKEQQKDGKVIYIKNYNGHDELVVGSNDRILILGSNKDREMFKNYMNNNR